MHNLPGNAFVNASHLRLYFFAILVQVKTRRGICFDAKVHCSTVLTGIFEGISGDFKKQRKFS